MRIPVWALDLLLLLDALVLGYIRCIERLCSLIVERGRVGAVHVCLDQSHENPGGRDPSDDPPSLTMRVVLVQLWGLVAVDNANQERQRIDDKKRKLRGKNISRAGDAQHDGHGRNHHPC